MMPAATLRFLILVVEWLGFGAAFFFRPRSPDGAPSVQKKREPLALVGLALQGVGFFIAWWRVAGPGAGTMPLAVQWLGLAVGAGGVALAFSAARHLGKQWALQARLVEGHELVTSGPYAYVRHPIYTAMMAMLLAVGMVVATPLRLGLALAFFLAGTFLRTRLEERLLRSEFGAAFEAYRKRAGWLWPRLAP